MTTLNPNSYDNSFPSSAYMVWNLKGEQYFIPLKETKLTGLLYGPLGDLALEQTFSFTGKECPEVVEAIYHFPLPGDAVLSQVTVRFGKVKISTKLKEREEAEHDYREAKKKGQQAVLVTKESADVFSLRVAGIVPGQKVVVTTSFVILGEQRGTGFDFRIPLTIAPRYSRQDESGTRKAKAQPIMPMIDPQHRFSLDVALMHGNVSSSSFPLRVEEGFIRLGPVVPDRDLVLRWEPEQHDGIGATVLTDGKKHFAVLVTPPAIPGKLHGREVTLLLDRSGSMSGAKWEAATWTAERFLDSLLPDDRFNLCLFHSQSFWLDRHPVLATENNKQRAREMLKRKDSGGTELGVALEQAMAQPVMDQDLLKTVLVVTDAEVSDEERIIQIVEGSERGCSVICIDSAPNSHLAREMARVGHGIARFLTSDPEQKDIATSLDEIMEIFASPLDQWISVVTDQPAFDPRSGEYRREGDLYLAASEHIPKGRSVLMLGRFKEKKGSFIDVWAGGADGGGLKLPAIHLEIPGKVLSRLFWATQMDRLEMVLGSARDPEQIVAWLAAMGVPVKLNPRSSVYRENRVENVRKALRNTLMDLSLKYGVPCSETAFVAVRKEPGKEVTLVASVPSALPNGWDGSFAPIGGVDTLQNILSSNLDANVYCNMSPRCGLPAPDQERQLQGPTTLYEGTPTIKGGKVTLFDSCAHTGSDLMGLLSSLLVEIKGQVDGRLLLFIGDLGAPRVTVDLGQLKKESVTRPMNVNVHQGQRVMLVLECSQDEGMPWLKVVIE